MRRPTPASEALRGAVKSAQQVQPVAYCVTLGDKVRLALNTSEVAELLGWTDIMVRKAIERGDIRSRYTGNRHAIPVSSLLQYLGEAS